MQRNKLKAIFLLFLLLFHDVISPGGKGVVDGGKLAGVCMKAMMESIPPSFCWKKGADAGIIPTGCPPGAFRSLALCYDNCKDNYYHVLGVCWQHCPSGYKDHGLTCYKSFVHWFFKRSYIPKSYKF